MSDSATRGFPPEHHVLRDLPMELETLSDVSSRAWLAVNPHDLSGYAADLLVTIDVLCGLLVGRAVAPDWMATADLSAHLGSAPVADTVVVSAEVIRAGRTSVVVDVTIFDGDVSGPVVGEGVLAFTRLPRRSNNLRLDPAVPGDRQRMANSDALPGAVRKGVKISMMESDRLRPSVAVSEWSRNSFGAMNGGVVAAVATEIGTGLIAELVGEEVGLADVTIHYLALATSGPLHAKGTVLRHNSQGGAVRIDLIDVGNLADDGSPRRVAVAHIAAHRR